MPDEDLAGRYVAEDLINEKTGEIYVEAGEEITEATITALNKAGVDEVQDARRSTTSTSGPTSATRSPSTAIPAAKRRCSTSTG